MVCNFGSSRGVVCLVVMIVILWLMEKLDMFLWMWFINLFISLVKLNIVLVCMYLMVFLLIIECGWVSLMWCNVVEWVVVVLEDICILGVMVLLRNLFLVDIILI